MIFFLKSQSKVNDEAAEDEIGIYKLEISPRIGRNKAKEQYAFFYKSNRFQVNHFCYLLREHSNYVFIWESGDIKLVNNRTNLLILQFTM